MLRITKTIELTLRKKQSRFSFDFWKGLTLALALHGLLILVFQIKMLPNWDRLKTLTPVAVEIDLKSATVVALPTAESVSFPLQILDPPLFFEKCMETPLLKFSPEVFALKEHTLKEPDFSAIEMINYTPLATLEEG